MAEIKYEIVERIAVLGERPRGWERQLNLISWNEGEPKYDIRDWSPDGTRRSVKTLSGGESFKASLALALGLSDEVQSAAGGIRLDTLFLDEGFGSLDEESLEQAMRVLAGLTEGDRLVGIISHVSALKDRIDRQVVVRKARTGGSTVELIV